MRHLSSFCDAVPLCAWHCSRTPAPHPAGSTPCRQLARVLSGMFWCPGEQRRFLRTCRGNVMPQTAGHMTLRAEQLAWLHALLQRARLGCDSGEPVRACAEHADDRAGAHQGHSRPCKTAQAHCGIAQPHNSGAGGSACAALKRFHPSHSAQSPRRVDETLTKGRPPALLQCTNAFARLPASESVCSLCVAGCGARSCSEA